MERWAIQELRTDQRRTSLLLRWIGERFCSIRPLLYILIVVSAVGVTWVFTLWDGILACPSSGYAPDRFVADCSASAYGDYEHGAFWFGLEPAAVHAASRAQVLFLGDSRVEVGFNTAATSNWFAKAAAPYYLLGFERNSNVAFAGKLLKKIKPHAKVYIINIDFFFERHESPIENFVMRDPAAKMRYEDKRRWQRIHRLICDRVPSFCGTSYVVFRSRDTGGYVIQGNHDFGGHLYRSGPVAYIHGVDQEKLDRYIASGKKFISHSSVRRPCMIATIVPYPQTNMEMARDVAAGLGLTFVAPELPGLQTFDRSHLDHASAERWTSAFFAAAGPQIRKCLETH